MPSAQDADHDPTDAPSRAAAPADEPLAESHSGNGKALAVVLFALLVTHLVFNVDPRVLYQADEALPGRNIPIFPTYFQGAEFFGPSLGIPGGLIEYLAANLSQYFGVPYGGAAVLAMVALAAFLLTDRLISLMGGKTGGLVRFIPPVLLVVICNRYTFLLADQLALLAVLAAMYLYLRLPGDAVFRGAVTVALIIASYYIAGAVCMLLAIMYGLHTLLARQRAMGLVYLAIGGLTPLAGGLLGGQDLSQAYLRLVGLHGGMVAVAAWVGLYAFFIILIVGLTAKSRGASADPTQDQDADAPQPKRRGTLRPALILLILASAAALGTLDTNVRTFRRICYYSQDGAWNDVILQARNFVEHAPLDMYGSGTARKVNRALYERGHLVAEMFLYPQSQSAGLLWGRSRDEPYKSDTLLQLGAVGIAEGLAMASQKEWPDRPMVLRLLARIAIVNDDMYAARRYLLRLRKDLLHAQFAKEQLAKIDGNYNFAEDAEIKRIRSFMPTDGLPWPISEQAVLEALVNWNPDNRMAFEYLMAHYLLTGQLEHISARVSQVHLLGYKYMPPYYSNAMLLWAIENDLPVEDPPLPDITDTMIRNEQFRKLANQFTGDLPGLAKVLQWEMPGSYFAYYYTMRQQERDAMEGIGR